jgi:hypothetical protein
MGRWEGATAEKAVPFPSERPSIPKLGLRSAATDLRRGSIARIEGVEDDG